MALHILLARQRSGTGAFGSLIDQHPEIRYLGELFHPGEIERQHNYFNFLLNAIKQNPERGLPGANEINHQEFFEYVENLEKKSNIFVDVKYSSTHHFDGYWHAPLDIPFFLQLCKRNDRKIVHLKRRNYLKTYVSGLLAERNKIWHAKQNDTIKITSLQLNSKELLDYLRSITHQVEHFESYLSKYPQIMTLEYENLFQASGTLADDVIENLSAFLEVDEAAFRTIKPFFVKQASDDLSVVIENYDEIYSNLKNTLFAWMLTS